jgi:hypothetical protein
MGEKDEKPIRVVDRRMFTPDGELRPGFEPEESAEPPAAPPPRPPAPAASRPSPPPPPSAPASQSPSPSHASTGSPASPASPASQAPHEVHERPGAPEPPGAGEEADGDEAEGPPPSSEPRSEFTAIVRSLATTAYSALGLLPDPSGARHREPAVARQMIDWLTVLESKTRNNLSFEESDFLSRVLYELRMAFVEVTGPGSGGSGRPRPAGR